ncbi:MAG: phospholipid carrier-dependent glycosyltransferase [Candidatus Methanoperedens sp.]|nr:phospholipid carrier-dependent glycosyltransferase [Candidatus Methanoperedens sp.]
MVKKILVEPGKSCFDKKDLLLCSSLVLFFFFLGIWNIGSIDTPVTGWTPERANESFYIDLKSESFVDSIYLMQANKPEIGYEIFTGSPANWTFLQELNVENMVLSWHNIPVGSTTRYLRFEAVSPGGELNEIIIYSRNFTKIPFSKDSIICESENCNANKGSLSNLVDEQKNIEDPPSYLNGAIFDEIYFARTAYEMIKFESPFEYTHPPLGKLFIASGIIAFGLNTFGWRIVPFIFGLLMIPIMYFFGKKMFNTRFGAFSSTFLMTFDSLHFVLSRISMVDIILSTFILLMFFWFYTYYKGDYFKKGWSDVYLPLLLSGFFFALAISVKWTALYGALAVLVIFLMLKRDERKAGHSRKAFFKPFLLTPLIVMFLSFVIIGFVIYVLSYTPTMGVPGEGSGLEMVFRYQENMLRYHETLTATHPFSSPWWSWIFMTKPVWVYTLNDPVHNTVSNIVAMGNPAIWWISIPFLLFVMWKWIKDKDSTARFIAVVFLIQLLPYMFIGRVLFIYHLMINVPFIILSITYGLNILWYKDKKYKYAIAAYFLIVIVVFLYFYPVLAGYPISPEFNDAHKWLSSWIF